MTIETGSTKREAAHSAFCSRPRFTDSGDVDVDVDVDEIYDTAGNRVDGTYIADALADLEASRSPGRPSLNSESSQGRSPQIAFRVQPELRAEAIARAQSEGTTLSALARKAFEQYVHAA
ncbi:MAG: hypothetical protein DLM55_03175 [Acidimicrobiales bacterium]|nr:MAG: hypothetical protein DLM55_03175 [Acidimicrobiales bacterium]